MGGGKGRRHQYFGKDIPIKGSYGNVMIVLTIGESGHQIRVFSKDKPVDYTDVGTAVVHRFVPRSSGMYNHASTTVATNGGEKWPLCFTSAI